MESSQYTKEIKGKDSSSKRECVTAGKAKSDSPDDESRDEEYDEDYYDEEDGGSTTPVPTTTTTSSTTTEKPIDHYYSHFDSKHEHDNFKVAQKFLEETHREKVTKVSSLSLSR
ncbi:APLP2 [Cordylochernes scorpioides]|uniref:APLP2 n=1 Tax=Cordylochernes scorpioides TaxID=51811 RepID=A0ABY6KSC8_9ARAC|nr:APLP2 [Cordylochernes scorpioides]